MSAGAAPASAARLTPLVLLCLGLVYVVWGSTYFGIKVAIETLPPLGMLAARFVLAGALAGLTGYLWVARYAVAYVDIAGGFELDVVAACVIGGIAIAGGAGSVAGAVMGALFLGIIKNALPVVGISPFWQMAISGSAILIAIAAGTLARRDPGRIILKTAEART